jgi:hypothetical protein
MNETLCVKYNDKQCQMIYKDCNINLPMTPELREFMGRMLYAQENSFDISITGEFKD